MPRCLNCPPPPAKGYYYHGDEKTPLGRGYSAKFILEGETMKGKNRKNYVSRNGRWNLVTLSPGRKSSSPRGAIYKLSTDSTMNDIIKYCRLHKINCVPKQIDAIYDIMKSDPKLSLEKAVLSVEDMKKKHIYDTDYNLKKPIMKKSYHGISYAANKEGNTREDVKKSIERQFQEIYRKIDKKDNLHRL